MSPCVPGLAPHSDLAVLPFSLSPWFWTWSPSTRIVNLSFLQSSPGSGGKRSNSSNLILQFTRWKCVDNILYWLIALSSPHRANIWLDSDSFLAHFTDNIIISVCEDCLLVTCDGVTGVWCKGELKQRGNIKGEAVDPGWHQEEWSNCGCLEQQHQGGGRHKAGRGPHCKSFQIILCHVCTMIGTA